MLNAISHLRLCSWCYFCLEHLSSLFTLLILIHLSKSSSGVTSCFFQDGLGYFLLLYISIRVISTLNQFIFISMTRLHALRERTCLPSSSQYLSTVPVQYMATIQLPKHMQEAEQDCTYRIQYLLYSITWLSKTEKYRSAVLVRK